MDTNNLIEIAIRKLEKQANEYADKMHKETGFTYRVRCISNFGVFVEVWSEQGKTWMVSKRFF